MSQVAKTDFNRLLSPRQGASVRAASFYDRSYSERLARMESTIQVRQTFLFQPYIEPDDAVLDFGCGTGALLSTLTAASKFGVDICEESRAIASRKGLDVRPLLTDFADSRFDKVISGHALEHVVNPAETLTQMRKLLKENGRLILCLPINEWVNRPQRKWVPNDPDMHLYTWTPRLIGNLLTVCGFEPLEIRTIHRHWPSKVGTMLARTSPTLFQAASWLSSRVHRIRQLLAVAKPCEAKTQQ